VPTVAAVVVVLRCALVVGGGLLLSHRPRCWPLALVLAVVIVKSRPEISVVSIPTKEKKLTYHPRDVGDISWAVFLVFLVVGPRLLHLFSVFRACLFMCHRRPVAVSVLLFHCWYRRLGLVRM
jgi:hypothetical protein